MIYSHNGYLEIEGRAIDVLTDLSLAAEKILRMTPVKLRGVMADAIKGSIDLAHDLANKGPEYDAENEPPMESLLEAILNGKYFEEEETNECE